MKTTNRRAFLAQLVRVRLTENPQDIAAGILDAALDAAPEDRAEAIGEVVDDAITFEGALGALLEGVDDVAAEHLAEIILSLINQARERIEEEVAARVEEAEERLRDAGVSEALIRELGEVLSLDAMAA